MRDIRKLIGDRIRDLRRKGRLSQEALGWKAKLHHTYIGGVERGERNVSVLTLAKIARALHVSVTDLFKFSADIKDPNKLKASARREIDKSDPEIVRLVFNLTRELNSLKSRRTPQKGRQGSKRPFVSPQ